MAMLTGPTRLRTPAPMRYVTVSLRARGALPEPAVAAWPIEELLARPLLTLLLALAVPGVSRAALRALLAPAHRDDPAAHPGAWAPLRRGAALLTWVEVALFGVLGAGGLAPPVRAFAGAWSALALGLAAALTALVSGAMALRIDGEPPHPLPARLALALRGAAPGAPPAPAITAAPALTIVAALLLLVLGAERLSRIAPAEAAGTPAETAWWRLRLVPTDGAAMLALAWASAARGDLARAEARLDEAERMGAPRVQLAEARAELLARGGDCAAAWAAFDESLRLAADEAFAREELPALELGGWNLPPAMIERCAGE